MNYFDASLRLKKNLFLFRYAVKYNEQLLVTLEEDEFSCKLRLAYKLEQVHNIMQDGQ